MDWDFLNVTDHIIAENKILVKELSNFLCGKDDKFYIDDFLAQDAHIKIIEFIKNCKNFRQKKYINALCSLLKTAGKHQTIYNEIKCTISKKIPIDTTQSSESSESLTTSQIIEQLQSKINDKSTINAIKILCLLLLSPLKNKISITIVHCTRIDIDDQINSFLNLNDKCWILRNPNKDSEQISIPEDFAQKLNNILQNTKYQWLAPTKAGKQYSSSSSLGDAFKFNMKNTYTFFLKALDNIDQSTTNVPYEGIQWDYFIDHDNCRDSSNTLYQANMKRLMKYLCGNDSKFFFEIFLQDQTYQKILDYFKLQNYSYNTSLSYVKGICKFIENTPSMKSDIHVKYCGLYESLKNSQAHLTTKRTNLSFEQMIPFMQNILLDESKIGGFRVIIAMILCGIQVDSDHNVSTNPDKEIGVLRPNDLMHTSFSKELSDSWIDTDNLIWNISANLTKNKTARSFKIPVEFIDNIRKIYGDMPLWLLLNKDGKPYSSLASIYPMFKKYIGVKFGDIRSAFVTYRQRTADVETAMLLAHKMGQTYKTAIINYNNDLDKNQFSDTSDSHDSSSVCSEHSSVNLSTSTSTSVHHVDIVSDVTVDSQPKKIKIAFKKK